MKKINYHKLFTLIFISVLALITTISNLGFEGSFMGQDAGVTFAFPEKTLKFNYNLWNEFLAPGIPGLIGTQSFIWFNSLFLLNKIILSPIVLQRIIYFLTVFITGFSAYYLVKTVLQLIFPKSVFSPYLYFASLVGGIIYMFNYYTMFLFSQATLNYQFSYFLCPLALAKIIEITELEHSNFTHIFSLLVILLFIIAANISSIAIFLLAVFIYFVFYIISNKSGIKSLFKPVYFKIVILIILLTSYIWLPILASGENPFANISSEKNPESLTEVLKEDFLSSARFNSRASSFLNLFRLSGLMTWPSFSYFKFFRDYSWLIILSFLLPLILLFGLTTGFYKKLERKHILIYFLFLLPFFLFLSKGLHGPFLSVYLKIYQSVPYFEMFRASYLKFAPIVIMSYSLFLGIFTYLFFVFLFRKFKKAKVWSFILFFLFLVAILAHNWPFFLGKVVDKRDLCIIPQDYYVVNDYLKKDSGIEKIFTLPPLGGKSSSWGENEENCSYAGADRDPVIFDQPILSSLWFTQNSLIFQQDVFNGFHFEELLPRVVKTLDLFNVKYILLHKDSFKTRDYGVGGGFKDYQREKRTKMIEEILVKEDFIKLVLKTENLNLYKIDNSVFGERIYIPKKTYFIQKGLSDLFYTYPFETATEERLIIFSGSKDGNYTSQWNKIDEIFVKGELENKVSEEELGMIVKSEKISLPYVQWKPGSLIYSLVLTTEKFNKWSLRKDPEKSFENYLLYGNKRIAEMGKWGEEDSRYSILDIRYLDIYRKEMEGAIETLAKMKESESENFITLWVKLKGTLLGHRSKINELTNYSLTDWNNAFQELEGQTEELKIKHDFSKLVYKFEIPRSGKYSLFINGLTDYSLLGERYFEEGKQEFVVPLGDVGENLLDDNLRIKNYLPDSIYQISFDYQSPGGGSLFVSEGKLGNIAQTTLFPTGKEIRHFEMFFKSSSEAARGSLHLSVSNVENLKVEWVYQPEIVLRLKNTDTGNLILDTRGTMPKITFTKINPTKYRVKVEGAKEPYTLVFSESFHKDWKAYINLQPFDFAQGEPSGLISPLPLSEQLSLKGNIVASYFDGEIKEGEHQNIFLNKQTFETWGKKPISEERHLLVNGYANSWYITPEDSEGRSDYEIIIEFRSQRFFYVGLAISGLTLLFCLGFLCYDLINGARRRKHSTMGFKKLDFSSQQ